MDNLAKDPRLTLEQYEAIEKLAKTNHRWQQALQKLNDLNAALNRAEHNRDRAIRDYARHETAMATEYNQA